MLIFRWNYLVIGWTKFFINENVEIKNLKIPFASQDQSKRVLPKNKSTSFQRSKIGQLRTRNR